MKILAFNQMFSGFNVSDVTRFGLPFIVCDHAPVVAILINQGFDR